MALGSRDKAERVTFLKQLIHMNERNGSHAFFRPTFNKHISEKERKMHVGVVTTPVVFNVRHLVYTFVIVGLRQFSDKLDAHEHEEHDLSRLTFFEKRKTPSAHRALMNIGSIESLDVICQRSASLSTFLHSQNIVTQILELLLFPHFLRHLQRFPRPYAMRHCFSNNRKSKWGT
ncbi:hypothetical protein GQX74_014666 [Glossina fuscipes]|nr:hypothetical protein GQX74_014666 [Glossina fuscipes]